VFNRGEWVEGATNLLRALDYLDERADPICWG
jgi:hypothetical protein